MDHGILWSLLAAHRATSATTLAVAHQSILSSFTPHASEEAQQVTRTASTRTKGSVCRCGQYHHHYHHHTPAAAAAAATKTSAAL